MAKLKKRAYPLPPPPQSGITPEKPVTPPTESIQDRRQEKATPPTKPAKPIKAAGGVAKPNSPRAQSNSRTEKSRDKRTIAAPQKTDPMLAQAIASARRATPRSQGDRNPPPTATPGDSYTYPGITKDAARYICKAEMRNYVVDPLNNLDIQKRDLYRAAAATALGYKVSDLANQDNLMRVDALVENTLAGNLTRYDSDPTVKQLKRQWQGIGEIAVNIVAKMVMGPGGLGTLDDPYERQKAAEKLQSGTFLASFRGMLARASASNVSEFRRDIGLDYDQDAIDRAAPIKKLMLGVQGNAADSIGSGLGLLRYLWDHEEELVKETKDRDERDARGADTGMNAATYAKQTIESNIARYPWRELSQQDKDALAYANKVLAGEAGMTPQERHREKGGYAVPGASSVEVPPKVTDAFARWAAQQDIIGKAEAETIERIEAARKRYGKLSEDAQAALLAARNVTDEVTREQRRGDRQREGNAATAAAAERAAQRAADQAATDATNRRADEYERKQRRMRRQKY